LSKNYKRYSKKLVSTDKNHRQDAKTPRISSLFSHYLSLRVYYITFSILILISHLSIKCSLCPFLLLVQKKRTKRKRQPRFFCDPPSVRFLSQSSRSSLLNSDVVGRSILHGTHFSAWLLTESSPGGSPQKIRRPKTKKSLFSKPHYEIHVYKIEERALKTADCLTNPIRASANDRERSFRSLAIDEDF